MSAGPKRIGTVQRRCSWTVFVLLFLAGPACFRAACGQSPTAAASGAKTVRVAGIVLKWLQADKAANYRRAEVLIRQAATEKAQIICTTECFLDGYAIKDKSIPLGQYRALGEPIPEGPYYRRLADLADELNVYLVAGMLEADGPLRHNTAVLIGPNGELLGKYRKQKLEHELVRNTPGDTSGALGTPFGKIGLIICADRRESSLVRDTCQAGADFVLCPSGGMFGPKNNDPILQSRSREHARYIVFVHPAEFLVTGPQGQICQCEMLGTQLEIPPEAIGTAADSQRVCFFDLPLPARK